MPAERAEERDVELLEKLPPVLLREPAPPVPVHQLVREAVVTDFAAVAHLDQVLEVLRDLLGVFVRVKLLRERRHGAGHGVERRAGFPEGEVVVVGEAVELLLRLVGEARVDAREGRRDLRERLEDTLVAEVLRHDREEIRLGILEPESVEQPADVRFCYRHVRRRRAEGHSNRQNRNQVSGHFLGLSFHLFPHVFKLHEHFI